MVINSSCSKDDEDSGCACTSVVTKYPDGLPGEASETSTIDFLAACDLDGEVFSSTNNRLLIDSEDILFYSEEGPYEIREVVCK